MSSELHNVIVAGARGNMGPSIVKTLSGYGFQVTILTRTEASVRDEFGDAYAIVTGDYSNRESLVSALKGQDVIVVCGVSMAAEQINLIDAAIEAGVKRFMPADFGMDLRPVVNRKLHINQAKVKVEEHLRDCEKNISHTSIRTGPLLDYCLNIGVLINMKQQSQMRYDDGSKLISTTTRATAAEATASALRLGPKSANRAFLVQDCTVSQNHLLELAKELTPGATWTVTEIKTEELAAKAEEAFREDPKSRLGITMQRGLGIFGKDAASAVGIEDNEELGISTLDDARIKELLRSFL